MSKAQIIDAIRKQNPTALPEFLGDFGERELESYLRRLTQVHGQRGRRSVWVREGDTHAVVTLERKVA